MAHTTTIEEFKSVYPTLEDALLENLKSYKLPEPAATAHYKAVRPRSLCYPESSMLTALKVFRANVLSGKCIRGRTIPDSVSALLGTALSEEQYFQAASLGWMVELLQAFLLVHDDIMDNSVTRRGKPCWYHETGVGMGAINDGCLIESAIFVLLQKYFRSHPAYMDMVELFHEAIFRTELGQMCDTGIAAERTSNITEKASGELYKAIVTAKTSYYSFFLPVALAHYQLEIAAPQTLERAKEILFPIGEYAQAQDDFLDVYGDPERTGKQGTDIKDNKCTWFIVEALGIANAEERGILADNYGQHDETKEQVVKSLYDSMDLKGRFREFEQDTTGNIRMMIDKLDESEGLRKGVFEACLNKLIGRDR